MLGVRVKYDLNFEPVFRTNSPTEWGSVCWCSLSLSLAEEGLYIASRNYVCVSSYTMYNMWMKNGIFDRFDRRRDGGFI